MKLATEMEIDVIDRFTDAIDRTLLYVQNHPKYSNYRQTIGCNGITFLSRLGYNQPIKKEIRNIEKIS